MAVHIAPSYFAGLGGSVAPPYLPGAVEPYPADHARILWDDRFGAATVTVSTEAAGFDAEYTQTPETSSWWMPTALPAMLVATFVDTTSVDCLGIAAHTLGSTGAEVTVQYWDGTGWEDAADRVEPQDDEPIMILFEAVSTTALRLVIEGTVVPRVGVVMAGLAMAMQARAYASSPPVAFLRSTEFSVNITQGGQFVGRSISRVSRPLQFSWSHLSEDWCRARINPFSLAARTRPFFVATRPGREPEDVAYARVDADIQPQRMGVKDFMSLAFDAVGMGTAA